MSASFFLWKIIEPPEVAERAVALAKTAWEEVTTFVRLFLCFLKKLSGVRMLTTFYAAKNDHRWVSFYFSKNDQASRTLEVAEARAGQADGSSWRARDAALCAHLRAK